MKKLIRTVAMLSAFGALFLGFARAQEEKSTPATKPTLFIISDSTAKNGKDLGWGDHLANYFDSSKITIANRAIAGRSSRTFQNEGQWDKMLPLINSGDYVFIQWGHNDGGAPDMSPYRGSLPGLGEETKDIAAQKSGTETVHTYGWYMRKYINDTRSKKATPILLSLTVRDIWKDGKVERGSGRFSAWTAEIAKAEKVDFIDLTNIIADHFDKLGQEKVHTFYPKDHTHTSPEGAEMNASFVVAGLKGTYPDSPLIAYLSEKGKEVAAYKSEATYPPVMKK